MCVCVCVCVCVRVRARACMCVCARTLRIVSVYGQEYALDKSLNYRCLLIDCVSTDPDHDAVRVHLAECHGGAAVSLHAQGLHHRFPATEKRAQTDHELSLLQDGALGLHRHVQ